MRCVTSLAPTMMTTTSGRRTSSRALANCRSRSLDSAPTTARFVRRTRRPVRAATPFATIAPTVSCGWSAPIPAAEESPSTTSSQGSPGPAPYTPLSSGEESNGSPMTRRARDASALMTP